MGHSGENAHRALRRLLANGPLTAVPKRPEDQALLARLAASRLEPKRAYRESEVNEALGGWLGSFCAPSGIDHVTMRRIMVDTRLLDRDRAGLAYRVRLPESERLGDEPAEVLGEIAAERESRKRRHAP